MARAQNTGWTEPCEGSMWEESMDSIRQEQAPSLPNEIRSAATRAMPRGITEEHGAAILPTASIRSGGFGARASLEAGDTSIHELADSIAVSGIIAPIVVREVNPREFEVIAGERRLMAARLLRLAQVPCIIRECSESEALIISLTENLQRHDLNPIEKAKGLRRLLEEFRLTQEETGKLVGLPQSAIAHYLRLLNLPSGVQSLVHDGSLSVGHGKVLAGIKDEKRVLDLALECLSKNKSVRELEASLAGERGRADPQAAPESPRRRREERELQNGLFLVIKESGETCSGTIEIPYYSELEKEWVLEALSAEGTKRAARQSRLVGSQGATSSSARAAKLR
jgi:ParB family transcriptional regulator, chromosome partitioning protein